MQIVLLPITTYKLYVKLKVFHLPFFISGVLAGLKPIFTVVFLSMKIWQEESGGIAAPAALLPPAWSEPVQALEMSRGRHHNVTGDMNSLSLEGWSAHKSSVIPV